MLLGEQNTFSAVSFLSLGQRFSNWVPQRGVSGSEGRTNHYITDSTQTIAVSIQKLLNSVVKSAELATESKCHVRRSGYRSVWGQLL